MIQTDGLEAAAEVDRLEERLTDLRQRRNELTDRSDELLKEIRTLKAESASAIGSGDLEALTDDSIESRIEALEKESRRITQSVDRVKRQIRTTEIKRDRTIGSSLEYFDALLAEEESALAEMRDALLPQYREYIRRWRALAAKRRRLAHCFDEWRQPGANIVGRKQSDIPEPVEVGGEEPADPSTLDGELPHLREKTRRFEIPKQAVTVHLPRRS